MSVRPDNRLSDVPMSPVTCGACGAEVLARKSSWAQTSVQWTADSQAKCRYRPVTSRLGAAEGGATVLSPALLMCADLRSSIEDAVRCGGLPVLDET
ncbi:Uncharacterised protein [Mycolicibacterium aurum]|uniref:Ferredoxin n=1 Tax=Mycolicibacterium aurum TaxID=1791 RepID=A0A3S4S2Q0_MYCAU|nr:hypothetical protein [Mycolicibacterium aurum]VEG54909.1 Uncharacterised protein [Mycolicibacterium aurum]